jgi:type IV pilus assembly protein PilV
MRMRTQQSGFTMIEVLVTIAILVIGLLGLAALQTLTTLAELESYQRSQAVVLVRDLADRMNGNKANLNAYVGNDIGLTVTDCTAKLGADLDLCEWGNQLNGAAEVTGGGKNVGAMIGARGCVVKMDSTTYLVTVAWQGLSRAGIPVEACGAGAYGAGALDAQRRTVSTVVRLALLAAP